MAEWGFYLNGLTYTLKKRKRMCKLEIFNQASKHGSYGFVFSYDQLLAFVIEVRAEERLKCLKEFEDRVTEIGKILE